MQSYPIEQHLRIRVIGSPQFGPRGDALYFTSDITGNQEIWRITKPGQWPEQLTFTGRGITSYSWSPNGEEIAFSMSPAAVEGTQIHAYDVSDKKVTQLTDNPDATHRWGGWSRDGTNFAYATNQNQSSGLGVYTQGRNQGTEEAKMIYEQQRSSPVYPVGWGPNDDRLLILEVHSNYNADLHLVNWQTGERTLLTNGPASKTRYRSFTWGPEGNSLYLITDHNHNWLYIARLDLESGEMEPVIQAESNIKNIILHADKKRLAYRKSENGFSEIVTGRLRDKTTIEPFPTPDLPTGSASGLSMNSDATRIATIYTTPQTKPDLHVINIQTGETVQWTRTGEPVPNDNFVAPEFITYTSFDGLEVPSYYTTPQEDQKDKLPAIISLHSGPRQHNSPAFSPLRQYYLEQGFVRFEPDYRGSSGHGKSFMELDDEEKREDSIKDIKSAADWLASKDMVDENRIVLKGRSYGGFLVLAALTRWPETFAAGAATAPIANFETFLENTSPERQQNREAEYGSLEDDRELLRRLSPIHDIDNLQSPLLIAHGEQDSKVPVEEAKQIAKVARESNIPVETHFIEDAGHDFKSREDRIKLFKRSASFFMAHT